jgi:eukaryotic-like serine/threonine-protein kinase
MNPGDLLRNRYRIEKALAAGGFGETYMAIDIDYPGQRQVVVKHLKPASNDPNTLQIARRLFESEAQVLAELGETSDRLPALYAYFEEVFEKQINRMVEKRSEFYLVQEFIAGQTLTAELAGRQLSEAQTIEVLQGILAGLAVVHSKNKIHRDLKPDNIMRRAKDGKLVLIDFGAVKEVRQAAGIGTNAALSASIGIGTQGYMPTEQAIGFPRLASDVYAVGAIGIQCLTGKHPNGLFDEDILALRWQHLCGVSSDLAAVLEKMVAQQPNERYKDGLVAMDAVEQLLVARQPQSPPMPSPVAPTQQSNPPRSSSPAPTKKFPIPPVRPAAQTVKVRNQAIPSNNTDANNLGRRKLFKFLGFSWSGLIGTLLLAQFLPKESTTTVTSSTDSKNNKEPDLSKISFTSVRLDNTGKILERPAGSAMVFQEDLGKGVSLAMVKIPAGKFMMGQTASEKQELLKTFTEKNYQQYFASELPQHQVTVPEFFLGQMLVTQSQWQSIMGKNPSKFQGDGKLPVDSVNWLNAMDFCQKLSQKTGRTYRLPTEAEWEYACRAGTTTPFTFGETITPKVVNYDGNYIYAQAAKGEYRQKTTMIGSFPANLFGLYDMHGNLWEWCLDEWSGNYNNAPNDGSAKGNITSRDSNRMHVLRGGSWILNPYLCRSAFRNWYVTVNYFNDVGFRVVYAPARTL